MAEIIPVMCMFSENGWKDVCEFPIQSCREYGWKMLDMYVYMLWTCIAEMVPVMYAYSEDGWKDISTCNMNNMKCNEVH